MDLRDTLLLLLASAVALVFAHGVWRAYFGQPKLKMKLDSQFQNSLPMVEGDELALLKAELPNGGARIVALAGESDMAQLNDLTSSAPSKSEAIEAATNLQPLQEAVLTTEDNKRLSPADKLLNKNGEQGATNHLNSLHSIKGALVGDTRLVTDSSSLDRETPGRDESSIAKVSSGEARKASKTQSDLGTAERLSESEEGDSANEQLIDSPSSESVGLTSPTKKIDLAHSDESPRQTSMFQEAAPISSTLTEPLPDSVSERKSAPAEQAKKSLARIRKRVPVVVHLHGEISIKQAANILSSAGWSEDPSGLFHFFSQQGERCFTLVNLVEPGVFDLDHPEQLIPGVSLILALDDVSDPAWAYRVMLHEAAKLAEISQAVMADGRRQPLTLESIEFIAEELEGLRTGNRRARVSA